MCQNPRTCSWKWYGCQGLEEESFNLSLTSWVYFEIFLGKTGENFSIFFRQRGSILLFPLKNGGIFLIFLPTTGDSDPVLTSDGEVRHSFDWTEDPDKCYCFDCQFDLWTGKSASVLTANYQLQRGTDLLSCDLRSSYKSTVICWS